MPTNHRNSILYVLFLLFSLQASYGITTSVPIKPYQLKQVDSVLMFRDLAFQAAKNENAELAAMYIERYIEKTQDLTFVEHSSFSYIKRTDTYKELEKKYLPNLLWASVFYIYSGLIGFFVVLMFIIRKKKDKVANVLLGLFVFIHSFFIIHIGLYSMNYTLYVPHTQSMSTIFSFLYGPLLYFYFRRIKTGYNFVWRDVLHLLPTILLIILFIPIYALPEVEKLKVMLGVGQYDTHPFLFQVTAGKMVSLLIYGFFTVKLFLSMKKATSAEDYIPIYRWQRNIVIFHVAYTIFYCVYGFLIINAVWTGFMFHMQLIMLSSLVLYVAYVSYVSPKVLLGYQLEASFLKYKNSGLTPSYSVELKSQVQKLLDEEKIYRDNNINLDILAERLGTTRHSASQVINEHFNFNFFELINYYRIQEAMNILKKDKLREKNIIDIAYEVGFNNKVTFNKSFKKINQVTPSQYVKQLVLST